MKLAWLTDLHLNFCDRSVKEALFTSVTATQPDAVLHSGDIGEAPNVSQFLTRLASAVPCPLYFVLGNHDFYRGSIASARRKVENLCSAVPNLHWLPQTGIVPLTETTCLVGHDGWGDGRYGDYWGSTVQLNDWQYIGEFLGLSAEERLAKLHALGDGAAAHFGSVLPDALARYEHVLVVTHVPPFREACVHEGKISDDDWLPHFTCRAVGDVLREAMATHPERVRPAAPVQTDLPSEPGLKGLERTPAGASGSRTGPG